MISLERALKILEQVTTTIKLPITTVTTNNALGQTLAQDVTSNLDLPPFNKSAMDGFAILADDTQGTYTILETVAAGQTPTKNLTVGTTIKVMTGAPVPENAGKVVRLEYVTENNNQITVHTPEPMKNICLAAEDIAKNDLILKAPRLIGPLVIANLIACGVTKIKAISKPKIAILTTGDEIIDDIEQYAPGKIMNSNGPLLENLCKQNNLDVVARKIVPDSYAKTLNAISSALDIADILILSGGVSVGEFDFVGKALQELELTTHFNKVAVKPGKPMTFASKNNKLVFGLPGNPVSTYLMFHLFVLRAARMITGLDAPLKYATVKLAQPIKPKQNERVEFIPAKFNQDGKIEPIKFNGSAHLLALLEMDGFIMIEPASLAPLPEGKGKILRIF